MFTKQKKRIVGLLLFLLIGTCSRTVAFGQLTVSDPVLDYQIPLEVANTNLELEGQRESLLYQYKAMLHDVQQDITESDTYTTVAEIYTTAQSTLKTAQNSYSLAVTAMSAPSILYNALKAQQMEYKQITTVQADTYDLAEPLVSTINLGSPNVLTAYGNMSMTPVKFVPDTFSSLSTSTQNNLKSQASTMSANDALIATTMQRASDAQAHTTADQASLKTLESQTFSTDTAQHTELATLQRINTALVLLVRAQQDANQMAAVGQLQHAIESEQELDAEKAIVYAAANWKTGMTALNTATQGASDALTYVPQ
jgi:hypothetical protein